ncbi:hypothetical protein OQJ18_12645 [Fluoribacter dumoffii]|uniref:hypothetical protein n=1 Tax=Fluoribacter dumoffii TaxID=463 RepID=UPI002242DF32|nr:hypothetical protein [Fluoribacter dumoffii]MCW8387436.1 hypothetical protein [Fluoribacter dumoffii]MCW8417056.1 hypothetical protein [Fluoribacter dumoffii]MCW8455104.1 hypothetical protein [Fluoribacter dumoffii]MCW8460819.1 hypothetical protein [Fluoribacter dumoffii]MCW8484261.1 hypothetical protein [Fluoribacter dumoffii]
MPKSLHTCLSLCTQVYDLSKPLPPADGSFGLIVDVSAVKHALKVIFNHLQVNGLFVFETETVHAVPAELRIWRDYWGPAFPQSFLQGKLLAPISNN